MVRVVERVNAVLDRLPRPGATPRGRPVFLVTGTSGYAAGVVVAAWVALATGRSLLTVAVMAAAGLGALWVTASLRRLAVGRDLLVQLQDVWAVLAAVALALALLDEPVLANLDLVAVGLPVIVAVGRLGCAMAGCCYGAPSAVGIRYEPHQEWAVPEWLQGARLFPVQLVDGAGLLVVAAAGAALAGREAGTATVWFLFASGVLRFATEGLRGGRRPRLAGLSVARGMAVAQVGFAVWLAQAHVASGARPDATAAGLVAAGGALLAALSWRAADPARRLRSRRHLAELRELVARCRAGGGAEPAGGSTSLGVTVAASRVDGVDRVSVGLPEGGGRRALCDLVARAVPDAWPTSALTGPSGLLLVEAGPPVVVAGAVELAARLEAALARPADGQPAPERAWYFARD